MEKFSVSSVSNNKIGASENLWSSDNEPHSDNWYWIISEVDILKILFFFKDS